MTKWVAYTDGACAPSNPGPAAWGAVVIAPDGGEVAAHSGFIGHGTNQIAEITAAIEGLSRTPEGAMVELVSDSQYVLKGTDRMARRLGAQGLSQFQGRDRSPTSRCGSGSSRWRTSAGDDALGARPQRRLPQRAGGPARHRGAAQGEAAARSVGLRRLYSAAEDPDQATILRAAAGIDARGGPQGRMRQITLDTETTGLEHENGHRIIEIGCVEVVERRLTATQPALLPEPGARDRRGRQPGPRHDARRPARQAALRRYRRRVPRLLRRRRGDHPQRGLRRRLPRCGTCAARARLVSRLLPQRRRYARAWPRSSSPASATTSMRCASG